MFHCLNGGICLELLARQFLCPERLTLVMFTALCAHIMRSLHVLVEPHCPENGGITISQNRGFPYSIMQSTICMMTAPVRWVAINSYSSAWQSDNFLCSLRLLLLKFQRSTVTTSDKMSGPSRPFHKRLGQFSATRSRLNCLRRRSRGLTVNTLLSCIKQGCPGWLQVNRSKDFWRLVASTVASTVASDNTLPWSMIYRIFMFTACFTSELILVSLTSTASTPLWRYNPTV